MYKQQQQQPRQRRQRRHASKFAAAACPVVAFSLGAQFINKTAFDRSMEKGAHQNSARLINFFSSSFAFVFLLPRRYSFSLSFMFFLISVTCLI